MGEGRSGIPLVPITCKHDNCISLVQEWHSRVHQNLFSVTEASTFRWHDWCHCSGRIVFTCVHICIYGICKHLKNLLLNTTALCQNDHVSVEDTDKNEGNLFASHHLQLLKVWSLDCLKCFVQEVNQWLELLRVSFGLGLICLQMT